MNIVISHLVININIILNTYCRFTVTISVMRLAFAFRSNIGLALVLSHGFFLDKLHLVKHLSHEIAVRLGVIDMDKIGVSGVDVLRTFAFSLALG